VHITDINVRKGDRVPASALDLTASVSQARAAFDVQRPPAITSMPACARA